MSEVFMHWIDLLPEVSDPIQRERDRIRADAKEAQALELHALALPQRIRDAQHALMARTLKRWSLFDIETAARRADALDHARGHDNTSAGAPASGTDHRMHHALAQLDGMHLAIEAIAAFRNGAVIRGHNLLSTASHAEQLATLARLLHWWNHAGRPVFERVRGDERPGCMPPPDPTSPDSIDILNNDGASPWLKAALRAALDEDPIQAALAGVLRARARQANRLQVVPQSVPAAAAPSSAQSAAG